MKPLHNKIPICLNYIETNVYPAMMKTNCLTEAGSSYQLNVFDKSFLSSDLNNAEYTYKCICNKQSQSCQCTVNVKFTNSSSDLKGPLTSRVGYSQYRYYLDDCSMECSSYQATIFLNGSTDLQGNMAGYPLRPFLNQQYFDSNPDYLKDIKGGYFGINITSVLLHELGHQYGIAHQTDNNGNPKCSSYDNGQMSTKTKDVNSGSTYLSNDDICAFKKLYCPSLTPVEEINIVKADIYQYPNPAGDFIVFSIPNIAENDIIIVYSTFGQKYIVNFINIMSGIRINISLLTPGVYFIKIGDRVEKFIKI
ncbi:MAG TPA: zinc-dependent metalloprotease [Candidatus Kapabacteria bacterium]|nr:zinc-dependent metalloprotease [Candidatus Kapabacteria bacterium]